jgi:hypothetical protein
MNIPLSNFVDVSDPLMPKGNWISSGLRSAMSNPLISTTDTSINYRSQIVFNHRTRDLPNVAANLETVRYAGLGSQSYGTNFLRNDEGVGDTGVSATGYYDGWSTSESWDMLSSASGNDTIVCVAAIKIISRSTWTSTTRPGTKIGFGSTGDHFYLLGTENGNVYARYTATSGDDLWPLAFNIGTASNNKWMIVALTFKKNDISKCNIYVKGGERANLLTVNASTLSNFKAAMSSPQVLLSPGGSGMWGGFATTAVYHGNNDAGVSGLESTHIGWNLFDAEHVCGSCEVTGNVITFSCTGSVAWEIYYNGTWHNTDGSASRVFYTTGSHTIATQQFTALRPVLQNTGLLNADTQSSIQSVSVTSNLLSPIVNVIDSTANNQWNQIIFGCTGNVAFEIFDGTNWVNTDGTSGEANRVFFSDIPNDILDTEIVFTDIRTVLGNETSALTGLELTSSGSATSSTATNAVYYIATDGSDSADGSVNSPWATLAHALTTVGGGKTFIYKPGLYSTYQYITSNGAGTAGNPTTLKSQLRYGAKVSNPVSHGIFTDENTDYIIIDGFESYYNGVSGGSTGVKLNGSYSTVRNCWLHDGANGIESHHDPLYHLAINNTFENNLLENNGTNRYDHGIYADGPGGIFRNNITRGNYGYGIHLSPSPKNWIVENNLSYDNGSGGIVVVHYDGTAYAPTPPSAGEGCVVRNNTLVGNPHGMVIYGCLDDQIYGNVFADNTTAHIGVNQHSITPGNIIDYNLFKTALPAMGVFPTGGNTLGPNNIVADPEFVSQINEVYYLKSTSLARNMVPTNLCSSNDFWGAARTDSPRDAGAFIYKASLEEEGTNKTTYWWYKYAATDPSDYSSSESVTIKGTSIDNVMNITGYNEIGLDEALHLTDYTGISLVEARVNGGAWQAVSGTNLWSFTPILIIGTNLIEIRATNIAGSYSEITSFSIDYTYTPTDVALYTTLSDLFTKASLTELYSSEAIYNGKQLASAIDLTTIPVPMNAEQKRTNLSKGFETSYNYVYMGWYYPDPFWDYYVALSEHIELSRT